jgi:NAD(P)-dependent dehydrogenase (short-subunit alcohol dehydrogenase family)
MNLKDKAVLITGAAARIGRGLAEVLAEQGCRLALHCHHSVAAAETLARQLRSNGCHTIVIKNDLLKPRAGEILIKRAFQALGRLDILVNNAAVFSKQPLATSTEKQIREILELNLMAPILMTRAFAGIAGKGKIINILDRRITGVESGLAAYLLSKKALADFTKIAALELAPDITVNGIAPGPVLVPTKISEREKAGVIPLGKRPTAADVAEAVVFLLKNDSITGEIIFVDGGQHLLGAQ